MSKEIEFIRKFENENREVIKTFLPITAQGMQVVETMLYNYVKELTTWNKITDINDLPKVRGKYHVCKNGKYVGVNASYRREDMLQYSHWCEILKPENPDE